MKNKTNTLIIIFICILFNCLTFCLNAFGSTPGAVPEYYVKTAYIFNFLKFIQLPVINQEQAISTGTLTIGCFNKNAYDALMNIKGKSIVNPESTKIIDVIYLTSDFEINPDFQKCNVLFITSDQKNNLKKILTLIGNKTILTFGEFDDFLHEGGIINFVTVNKNIKFEVNIGSAKDANIEIRSQLLKMAHNVIMDNENKGH